MAKDDVDKCSKAYRESAAFKRASFHPPEEIWSMFADAEGFTDVIYTFKALVDSVNIDQDLHGIEFYQVLKSKLTSWKCQSLWDLLNARLKFSEYKHENINVAKHVKCIIVGAGPIGLRTAIEMLMLGCRTVVVERRKDFARNNVLHLWPFLLQDFRALGAKKFYGKFGAGCIDHINIKTLQTILLKVALVLGVEIYPGVEFKEIVKPTDDHGWRARVDPANHENLSKCDFDIIIGADGKKNVLPGFTQVELRGSLAIGITCNFINNNTPTETSSKEISGISYQFKPMFFDELKAKHGVELENLVYYKDETHYFVMTARKTSLINQGVILKDFGDPSLLVDSSNINKKKLIQYACNAVKFSTTLQNLEFKKLSNGQPDIALFDFTSLKKAENASRIIERKKHKLLLALVGDSLIEPFWPTGSGCGRGVLSALDVAWMVRQFALNYPPLAMIRERENVFKLLSASTNDSLQKNYHLYSIDPKTRYSALDTKKIINLDSLKTLYDTDDLCADLTISSPSLKPRSLGRKRTAVERRRSSGGAASRPSGRTVAGKTKRKLERQESKTNKNVDDAKNKLSIGDKKKFFEDHNKKMGEDAEVPKPKRATLTSDEFSGLEGIDEDINESDDDVLVDEQPATKKKTVQQKSAPLKRQSSKEHIANARGKPVKRQASKESFKRQQSREAPKILKTLKRQSSIDDGETPTPLNEDVPTSKKKVFQAKGGGLKSKTVKNESRLSRLSERSDSSKQKRKSTSDKKLCSMKKKTRKSAGSQDEVFAEIEASSEKVAAIEPVDAKTFFSKWLEQLLPQLFTGNSKTSPPATVEHPLDACAQSTVISVMAMSLLYDCNKPPRRRTTDLKLKEIIANANTRNDISLKPSSSFDKHETTEELSFIKAGRVRDSMAKWQKLVEKEEQKDDYYDFIRKGNMDTVVLETERADGILLVKHEHADFTPKDVIDVEEQLLADEEEERKRSRLAKMTTGIASSGEIELQLALEQFCDQQSPLSAILMLQVLYNVHKRILDEPSVDKHYRIYTKGKTFEKYVWRWEGAKDYFLYIGWITCGDFLILSKSQPVHLIVKVIEDVFRKNKKVQLLYSGSVKSQNVSISDDSNLNEEMLATYTNIEAPPERDSAIGSGMDDDDDLDIKSIGGDNDILQRLQSKEHSMGDEAYIVVDFVNDTNCMPEEPSQLEVKKEKPSTLDTIQIADDGSITMENSSPFTTVSLPSKVESDFTFVPSIPEEHQQNNESIHSVNETLIVNGGCEKTEDEIEVNVFKENVKNKRDIKVEEKVEITVGKCDSAKKKELEQKMNPAKGGRKKVFSAGHGLKKATTDDKLSSAKVDDPIILDGTKYKNHDIPKAGTPSESGNTSPTLHKDLNINPTRTTPTKKSPNGAMQHSPNLERTSSLKSINSESSPTSIVKQNKLLFDQQIANELKTKYSSPQDIVIPRNGSTGKGGVNAFEKGIFERKGSLKERGSNSHIDTCEIDLTGIVAGARSLFEGGVKDISDNSTKNEIKKSSSVRELINIKEPENIRKRDVDKTNLIKQTPVIDCESIIINTVPEYSSSLGNRNDNKKKKKFPFKKKGKNDKKQENNKTVELLSAKLIEANQSYDERAIDVETVTSVNDSSYEGGKSGSFSSNIDVVHRDDMNNQTETLNFAEQDQTPAAEFIPIINTDISLASLDITEQNGESESGVRRNSSGSDISHVKSKKRRRLCKKRESISSYNETMEIASDPLILSSNICNNGTWDLFVTGTIVNLIPDDDEEMLTETVLTDEAMCNWSFDKLREMEDGDELAFEKQPDTNLKMEVAEPLISSTSIEAIKIDIDSLQNESCIDDDLIEENGISTLESPVIHITEPEIRVSINSNTELREANNVDINVGESDIAKNRNICISVDEPGDDDLTSILDEMSCRSDITGSFHDGDSLSMNSTNTIDEKRKKKKKMFPFNIKLGKKNKDKSKGELGSPNNVFSEDACSESSYKISKKKKKSKSIDNLHELGQTMSSSSIESLPKVSTSSSHTSPHLDPSDIDRNIFKEQGNSNEKVKSKKSPFFKKKKSGVSTPIKHSSSFTDAPNENTRQNTNTKLNGVTVSKPVTSTSSNHHHTNGHTSHTNGHTSHTNGHASVSPDKLI